MPALNLNTLTIEVQNTTIRASSFVMELDGMKVIRLELDGQPLRELTRLHFCMDWENGELPRICTSIPRLTMERFLIDLTTPRASPSTAGGLHLCNLRDFCYGEAGPAATRCEENDKGELWVDNGEYASQVNFCPACGYRAKVPSPLTFEDKGCRVEL